jgi:acetolactate synthase I/II/III large subunit
MNGAEALVNTALAGGIEVCFANPGTTELPLVTAFDVVPGIRAILGLSEGVCAGAADGYGRMLEKPAMALLHLGPGFANAIAYLHDARRSGTPLFAVVGDHAAWHRGADAPLTMDIEALAGTVSGWVRTNRSTASLVGDTAEAITQARTGRIATLIVPHDHLLGACGESKASQHENPPDPVDIGVIEAAARIMRKAHKSALMLGGSALRQRGLLAASRIQKATGCGLITDYFPPYVDRGAGLPAVERIPYFPEPALAMLSQYEAVIFAGTGEPVTFFGYPGVDSYLLGDDQQKLHIAGRGHDLLDALDRLADAVAGPGKPSSSDNVYASVERPALPEGHLTPEKAHAVVAAVQPEGAIIVDEGLTSWFNYYPLSATLPPHSQMTVCGGAVGYGMPCAVGAAIACPDRPVINIESDGSGMYTLQALWTQARERLNVTTLICSNRSYNILKVELARSGIISTGPSALALTEIDHPAIDWVKIASGLGVPGQSVTTAEALARALSRALREPGPHLIEMLF